MPSATRGIIIHSVYMQREHFYDSVFPAPITTSLNDLNSNSDKFPSRVSDMIESLRSTQIAFLIRNAFWVSWGSGQGTKNIRARENRMKQVVRTSFLSTRPRVFPPPGGDRFSAQTAENRNYTWACLMDSAVIINTTGPGCSNVGYPYPPDKSLSSG